MRILILFIDMLRPNLMNVYNNKIQPLEIDREIKKIGGILYTNCFTSGPDTPRSLSEFWSGVECYNNGCNTKLKYPRYFLKSKNFLEVLNKCDYQLNLFSSKMRRNAGIFPPGNEKRRNYNKDYDLNRFLERINFNRNNSFTFIDIPDFHMFFADYGFNFCSIKKGYTHLVEVINMIKRKISFNNFDLIIIFSDHGFKLNHEWRLENKVKSFINEDRTKVFLLWKEKKNIELIKNDKLCSLVDLFPSILKYIGFNNISEISGIPLKDKKEHDYIIVEDNFILSSRINMGIDIWGLITKKINFYTTIKESYLNGESNNLKDIKKFEKILSANSKSYNEYKKEYKVYGFHQKLKSLTRDKNYDEYYINGVKRIKISRNNLKNRLYLKLRKVRELFKIW